MDTFENNAAFVLIKTHPKLYSSKTLTEIIIVHLVYIYIV